ncbi:MAG: tRNA guanosine(34) transglycosylase Tgt [Candidatus Sungbacteria bacterium]|nr:tRNA guanosine(34) transglycosylase Tgt [Candidatus Sungbacteria bacterium]
MIEFRILKQSKKSGARIGILKTTHGEIETPSLVPVATRAAIKTLTARETERTKSRILIANTFHLHLRPGEHIIKHAGGLHPFMRWNHPLMTDSGGFQVFSLGFGKDMGVGKLLKIFPEGNGGKNKETVRTHHQPKEMKIADEGVWFRSPIDGRKLFLGPKESIKIQESLGADIMFAFDECTPPLATRPYIERSLARTHAWAKICLDAQKTKQALFGIVQGSHFKDLREKSAKFIGGLGFPGFGIGGDLGSSKEDMLKILDWTMPHLAEEKPRHLLGIGYLQDMEAIIKTGIDLFDCTVPTHYARRGIAFTALGKLNLNRTFFLKDKKPLDKKCSCETCAEYTRDYICHLMRAGEITAMRLLTFHNLFYFNTFVEGIRDKIKRGKI